MSKGVPVLALMVVGFGAMSFWVPMLVALFFFSVLLLKQK